MPRGHGGTRRPRARPRTPPTSLGHRPALDGLRAVAFLAVFAGHAQLLAGATPGSTAMFVFFALSGFLITALAIDEVAAHGALDLKAFFQRRARRLLPALALFLSLWLLVDALFGHDRWMRTVPGGGRGAPEPFATAIEGVLAAAVYVLNWAVIEHAFTHYLAIAHLWSLSVEGQFYLAWAPLVALVLPRRR